MPKQIVSVAGCAAVVTMLAIGPGDPARAANECLTAPKAQTPPGQHWFYHLNRTNGQKCWYLGGAERKTRDAAARGTVRAQPAVAPLAPLPQETSDRVLTTSASQTSSFGTADAVPAAKPAVTASAQPTAGEATAPAARSVLAVADDTSSNQQAADQADTATPQWPAQAAPAVAAPPRKAADPPVPMLLILVAAALALGGLVLPFGLNLAQRRRVYVDPGPHAWNAQRRRDALFGRKNPLHPPEEEGDAFDHHATLRKILRSLDRHAA